MADSDNSTSLPANSKHLALMPASPRSRPPMDVGRANRLHDPALQLREDWDRCHRTAVAFCRLQQKREKQLLRDPSASGVQHFQAQKAYRSAQLAEFAAIDAEERLLATLSVTRATTLNGVLAKLEIIASAGEGRGAMGEFPWPLILSTIADLKHLSPHRSGSDGRASAGQLER